MDQEIGIEKIMSRETNISGAEESRNLAKSVGSHILIETDAGACDRMRSNWIQQNLNLYNI